MIKLIATVSTVLVSLALADAMPASRHRPMAVLRPKRRAREKRKRRRPGASPAAS